MHSDEPEAEGCSEDYSTKAITYDPSNPEAHQTLASVRMSQSRPDDARTSIETSMDIWINTAKPGDQNWPAYPARIALAKILLELSLHERAIAVLHTIQDENDEDPEGWYLYGWCYYRMGGGGEESNATPDTAEKAEWWDEAKECLDTVLQVCLCLECAGIHLSSGINEMLLYSLAVTRAIWMCGRRDG